MSTLAQVQADTISDEVKRLVVSDWFASEWQLVTMNDRDQYSALISDAMFYNNTAELSDKLRGDWEHLAEQVTELVAENISHTASLFISQILQGWGSLPFDIIAREAIATNNETK
jgi:DICT domain-containing protein